MSGDVLTAAQLNAELRSALLGAFPLGPPDVAWTAWTPTLTNLTLGNGVRTAKYTRVGRTIHYYLKVVFGSTSAITGSVSYSLPVTAADSAANVDHPTLVTLMDAGTGSYIGGTGAVSATEAFIVVFNAASTYLGTAGLSATVPFTWTTSDAIVVRGTYEAAT